jgi:glycosyltransferase involved in cell wall biosynthesis
MNHSTFKEAAGITKTEALLLSLVVPVFNESDTIDLFLETIESTFKESPDLELEIVFVNDGSSDNTLEKLVLLQKSCPAIRIVDLSRNFGKEAALTAGLQECRGQVVVPIDVDLQDPPEIILNMLDRWREGYEVVVGRRTSRNSDTWAKKTSAKWFYKIHNKLSDPKIPENVGDFRLLDRNVVDALNNLHESRRFMKGLFAWIGFKTTTIDYARPERVAGDSKFNSWRLWNFALEGLTSFTTAPLRLWTYLGLVVALFSLIFAAAIVIRVLIYGIDVPGYASLVVAITLLSGIQLIGIGIIGEYLGRAYIESKRRPVYVVRKIYESLE